MGLYWIAGAVIRCFQQVLINKHLDKVDFDELVKKNAEKNKVKNEKKKNAINAASLSSNSKISTKAIVNSSKEDEEKIEKAYENSKNAKKDSITAKANLVKEFNNK